MKKVVLILFFFLIPTIGAMAQGHKYQRGYVRKSTGTYVNGHYKTRSDRTKHNNMISCNAIPKKPIEGARQYCEELASFAARNDYYKADELTRKYLDTYEDNDLYEFLIELKRQLRISEKHHLGAFILNADSSKYPNLMELMRRVVAAYEAEKKGVHYTGSGSEKAALFCSLLVDLSKEKNYDKAKSLMKRFVNDYVTEFYSDGSVYLDDNRYEECKQFCLSFKKNMTPEVYEFLNSEGMKSEVYTQFQLMCLAGLQAAVEK